MTKAGPRLDQRLVELGLAETRSRAQALIMAGLAEVDGQVWDKAGARVKETSLITVKEKLKYVSRGGLKLEGALAALAVEVAGKVCLDVGSSTGGFTDCLLQQGAKRVYCVDVGKGVLAWKLREDPRVTALEGVNARYLKEGDLPEPVELMVVDVSFISLTLILPAVAGLVVDGGQALAMVKPQFEAGKGEVGKGGVVRDPAVIEACVDKVSAFSRELGLVESGRAASEVKGPKGNQEVFLLLIKN